jgi:CCR4-NOT transcription complex subunit 1
MHERAGQLNQEVETNGINGFSDSLGLTNGNIDDFLSPDTTMQRFRALHVDPPLQADIYEEPDEQVQDKVLFVLNNVSDRNIEVKLKDLKDTLEDKHYQWFASYLVEERAKLQPNYQQLYFDLLDLFGDKTLWAEVLRETYVSVIRMLNAEATMNSTVERTHLKISLDGWGL